MIGKSALHALRVALRVDQPHTQTTLAEQRSLVAHARNRLRAVEIGVYEGANTVRIAGALGPAGVLYAVDPFFSGSLGICWGEVISRRHVSVSGHRPKVVFVKAFSWDALKSVGERLDFVFLDGDHSLEGITRDWEDWSQRIVPGGVILLHDTRASVHNPGVEKLGSALYFEQHIRHDPRFRLVEQVDTMSVLERRPEE